MFPQIRLLLLVPFFYLVSTRMNTRKGLVSNLVTAWLPGILIVGWWGGRSAAQAVVDYGLAYLAFVAVYEIGYYINDTLGTRNDETPRHRLRVALPLWMSVVFVGLRLATVILVSLHMGLHANLAWVAGMGALLVVMVFHNTLDSSVLKAVTFFQMSTLRFSLPVLPLVPSERWSGVVLIAVLHFVYPRFITYLEAKGRLRIPERKSALYGVQTQALLLPIFALTSTLLQSWLPVVVGLYYLTFQVVRLLLSRHTPGMGVR